MNSTIDESKKITYLVGGGIILLTEKDKMVEMPEEEARNAEEVAKDTTMGIQLQDIKLGNGRAEDFLSKEQIKELERKRKDRRTKPRARRKETEAR